VGCCSGNLISTFLCTTQIVAIDSNTSSDIEMKSYSSLFPSYYYCEDDTAVFFESNQPSDRCPDISSDEIPEESSEIKFQAITGSSQLVNLLKRAKAASNSFGRKTFEELRGKTNYYEGLGKGCYLNRSAMKLVNLDYVFSLIEPSSATYATRSNVNDSNDSLISAELSERPHFSFVDLCGGPGGFIECIVLKCRHLGIAVTGFGMTLLIGDEEQGLRGIMKACNWNIFHLQDPPYSVILSDQKECSLLGTELDSDGCNKSRDILNEKKKKEVEENSHLPPPSNERIADRSSKRMKSCDGMNDCECRVFLVGGETGTGDICAPENMQSLFALMQLELPLIESSMRDSDSGSGSGSGSGSAVKKNKRRDDCSAIELSNQFSESKSKEQKEGSAAMRKNKKKYVSFVCSDGFDHETEAFRIVLCQVIGMIKTLKEGGNFIMKVFSCTKVQTEILIPLHLLHHSSFFIPHSSLVHMILHFDSRFFIFYYVLFLLPSLFFILHSSPLNFIL
jgi:FtsJ-like methyltransferase